MRFARAIAFSYATLATSNIFTRVLAFTLDAATPVADFGWSHFTCAYYTYFDIEASSVAANT